MEKPIISNGKRNSNYYIFQSGSPATLLVYKLSKITEFTPNSPAQKQKNKENSNSNIPLINSVIGKSANNDPFNNINTTTKILGKQQIKLLNNDIELYQIGKNCGGLKKRFAFISKGQLFSSPNPLNKFVVNSIKDNS